MDCFATTAEKVVKAYISNKSTMLLIKTKSNNKREKMLKNFLKNSYRVRPNPYQMLNCGWLPKFNDNFLVQRYGWNFYEDPISSFYVKSLMDKQTDKLTNAGWNIKLIGRGVWAKLAFTVLLV